MHNISLPRTHSTHQATEPLYRDKGAEEWMEQAQMWLIMNTASILRVICHL